jgi:hypothetical protein
VLRKAEALKKQVGKSLLLHQQLNRPTCWLSLAFLSTANLNWGYKEMWLHADATITQRQQ